MSAAALQFSTLEEALAADPDQELYVPITHAPPPARTCICGTALIYLRASATVTVHYVSSSLIINLVLVLAVGEKKKKVFSD